MNKISGFIKTIFGKIKLFLVNLKDLRKCLISFSLVLFSSLCLLVSGAVNSETNVYKSASYVAELMENSNDADHLAVIVEQKDNGVVPDTATELRSLYGVFGNRKSNYAGTINAAKDRNISFTDFDSSECLSFVYVQTGVQVSDKEDDEGIVHHRMEFYPLELMFEFYPNNPTSFYSFLYLSTSQARKLIDYQYPGLFNPETPLDELLKDETFILKCKDLIGSGVNIRFNEEIKIFQITNIYYEQDFFYNIVHTTIGEFLVGYNQYPEGFQKQATYFLNKYEYQNKFYLDYIRQRYSKTDCMFDVASLDLESKLDKNAILHCLDERSNTISIIFLVASILCILSNFYLMFKYKLFNLTFATYVLLALLLPCFVGFIIWKISKNIAFFSPYFTVWLLSYLIFISFFVICLFLIEKWKKRVE